MKNIFSALVPVVLLVCLLAVFFSFGPIGVYKKAFPPIEILSFEKITLDQETIVVDVLNDGPDPISIAQVQVNDAYNQFEIDNPTIEHLERAQIRINYPWNEGLPLVVKIITSDGVVFEKEIPVATASPKFEINEITTFALLGIYVGVIPVFLGLLWLPFLRSLPKKWYYFLLFLTLGLLTFLAVDAFEGAFEHSGAVAGSFQGIALVALGFMISLLILTTISKHGSVDVTKGGTKNMVKLSYLIALGIGLHNLGEGLAIGTAYSIGEIALGSLLVVGFMIHNLTEGIAIVAPITKEKLEEEFKHLLQLGLLAGVPTILGAWIGGFVSSPLWSVIFLSVGAGAVIHVIIEIVKHMHEQQTPIFTFTNLAGFCIGLLVMYLTGLLVG